ncbi:protein starmaker-like [Oppia nitens]|uniref:protein starmaker-like n=1 Tax=Oppia nitens TaxID=1686743 RepID=UPI0023D9A4A3|nr:protein starmaker-like [Oppia nitens]
MCSLINFIDNQNLLIKSRRKAIKSLHLFLDSLDEQLAADDDDDDTDGHHHRHHHHTDGQRQVMFRETDETTNEEKIKPTKEIPRPLSQQSTDLMFDDKGLWLTSAAKSELRRQQLAEERRQDYKEFLEEKAEKEKEIKRSKRNIKLDLSVNYNELLNEKKIDEQKYRQLTGMNDMNLEDDGMRIQVDKQGYCVPPMIGSVPMSCSNNKFDPEYITPRSRLLATHSSRLKAMKYREELRKQCEENKKLKEQEKQRILDEDKDMEQKIDAQRQKLLAEFQAEQRAFRDKQQQERDSRLSDNSDKLQSSMSPYRRIPASPLSMIRSPTYMHIKDGHPYHRSQSPKKHSRSRQQQQTVSNNNNKSNVSRSLASVMSSTRRRPETTSKHKLTAKSIGHQKLDGTPTSAELYNESDDDYDDDDEEEEEEDVAVSPDNHKYDKQNKDIEFRKRVLSQLSEVRQMMESDHILMMEDLRKQQQLDQYID